MVEVANGETNGMGERSSDFESEAKRSRSGREAETSRSACTRVLLQAPWRLSGLSPSSPRRRKPLRVFVGMSKKLVRVTTAAQYPVGDLKSPSQSSEAYNFDLVGPATT